LLEYQPLRTEKFRSEIRPIKGTREMTLSDRMDAYIMRITIVFAIKCVGIKDHVTAYPKMSFKRNV